MKYDREFYDIINEGSRRSAAVIVPMLCDIIEPTSVIDVGCGEGIWTKAFKEHGCSVLGIDGPYIDINRLQIAPGEFRTCDLETQRVPNDVGSADLAICLEVAEHLTESRADGLIDDLVRLAPVVVFSAAVPGQGGVGHVNEAWPAYWAAKFWERCYDVTGAFRWRIWDLAVNGEIENWYAQNMLVAVSVEHDRSQELEELLYDGLVKPIPVVHPVLWESRQ